MAKESSILAVFDNHAKTMKNLLRIVLLSAVAAATVTPAPADTSKSWYTQKQADNGHMLFNNHCAECHRPDLTGAMGPALKGPTFLKRWGGQTVEDLFQFEHEKMPATNPGSLPKDEIMAITAYVLSKNGEPAGQVPLDEVRAKTLTLPKAK